MSIVQPQRLALLGTKAPGELLIHEIYRSLQGESAFAGLPCVFVRLAVCDARCRWCDTPHAFQQGEQVPVDEVFERAMAIDCPLVEVTGGEPLLQPEVHPLMRRLLDSGRQVLLETSGAHDVGSVDRRVHIIMDIKCPDSGECENNYWANLDRLKKTDETKFVIASRRDFDWAIGTIKQHDLDNRFGMLMSPVFDEVEPVELSQWILDSGRQIRLQLQLHKLLWGPKARGV
ncbi:MAG: 7-carboxy-7-deazaguanine synthase QueE [Gemmataceae bacterium]